VDEIIGGWRKLYNEELHNLYSSPNIISMIKSKEMIWAKHVARMGAKSRAHSVLVTNPRKQETTRKSKYRYEDTWSSIKLWEYLEWLSNCWLRKKG
jgi:hypothetical protein